MSEEFERFADVISQANHIAEMVNSAAVNAERAKAAQALAPEQNPDDVDPYCVDCGEEIETGRLAMFKCRCFACQSLKEKKEKMYARAG